MISRRALELITAVITAAFGIAVVISSLDNGIGWSTAGVESGTFPFMAGLIILGASAYNAFRGTFEARLTLISAQDVRRIAGLFVPAAIFIGAIPALGMYVAAGAYMLGTLAWSRLISVPKMLLIAVATPLALYLVFERMFQSTLPHGALGAALGY